MEQDKFDVFIEYVKQAFGEVTQELLDTAYQESPQDEIDIGQRTAVIIGFTGNNRGRILMETDLNTVADITDVMNAGPLEDPLDRFLYIGEFANIFSGRATTYINNHFQGTVIRLAPPAIFSGVDLKVLTPNIQTVETCFVGNYGKIILNIGFEGV